MAICGARNEPVMAHAPADRDQQARARSLGRPRHRERNEAPTRARAAIPHDRSNLLPPHDLN
jgi:hypothetical protein